jgi:hypothetical protein
LYYASCTATTAPPHGPRGRSILAAFARTLDHPAKDCLEQPFVHYVEDRPQKARKHFFGVSEAKPDFVGIVITDNLVTASVGNERLQELQWDRREIENYLCYPEVLEAYAQDLAEESPTDGPLFATSRARQARERMVAARPATALACAMVSCNRRQAKRSGVPRRKDTGGRLSDALFSFVSCLPSPQTTFQG